ncbi:hypothetical protein PVL29_023286 [Vitis rotundifolia]|uniref:ATPase AAA-type core domain-containing protein n=1 Tax=Vitis rotundifolia TaxID=103349 RepID=A0AA38YNE1_VITRO|nr:hypothetical protein PVL29_023286 [Vitis rotundifolia]
MDCSAEQEKPVVEDNGGDLGSPELRTVRRRLIQKTLFPHRSQGAEEHIDGREEKDCGADEEEDQTEEYCGSQGKKKKRPKRKAMSRPRASKKASENDKEALSMRVDDKDSPVTDGSGFFVKVSSRRLQKKQQCINSDEGNDDTCSPSKHVPNMRSSQWLKWQANTTPIKNVTINGLKRPCTRQISTDSVQSEPATQPIPDLRLEAKMTAEENSRMFAGRQIHPFFSSWKVGKRCNETTDPENKGCSVQKKDKSITFGPIHVFERIQDDDVSVDWKNWNFCERSIVKASCAPESASSSVFEGSAESLDFDNFLNVPHSIGASYFQSEESLDQCPIQLNLHEISTPCSTMSANEQVPYHQLSKKMEMNQEGNHIGFFTGDSGCGRNMDAMLPSRFLQESMTSYYLGCGNQAEGSLWINKYQPEKAIEVCGNGESVKLLSEWLHLWHEKDSQSSKKATGGDKCIMQDSDNSFCGSNSDSDLDEGTGLKNVLLVTGPVGSGKSAAIYACAKEQGFRIIEINTSGLRSGTVVKQRIGEALESHGLKRSLENPTGSQSKHIMKSFQALPNGTATQEFDSKVIELIPSSDEEDSHDAIGTPEKHIHRKNRTACDRGETITLILFEDVDITFPEDRGLIAAIQQLAETAKRPIILTSNGNNPVLPDNLDRLEVCFTLPSPKELLCHAYMVCAAEKTNIQPWLIERFIEYCQGDIRKTLMHLQFWCQGKRYRQGKFEENHYQCSETANSLCIHDTCKSFDISRVPESSFVPETEMSDGTELLSVALSCGRVADIAETVSICNNLTQNPEKSVPGLSQNLETMINGDSVHEEVGDSQNEHVESVTREYPVMDECSRMAFTRGSKSLEDPGSWMVTNWVQETWRKLRGCHTDLRRYAILEQRDASQIVELTYKMSNLISEADQLRYNCHPLDSQDSLDLSTVPCGEESHAFSWYDEQLQMASTIAQHGFCFYSKYIAAAGSILGSDYTVDLASEMLASTTNTMALGKLTRPEMRMNWTSRKGVQMELPKSDISLRSETEPCLCDIVQSVVPSKSYLGVKGHAFHEYLSSLSQISRSEASRLSENINQNKRRRGRASRHYLSTGACMLSPDDISLLCQSNCYGTDSSKQQMQD